VTTNPHRFGSATAGYVDLPVVQRDINTSWIIPGGQARSAGGTLLTMWTGAPKVRYEMTLRPWAYDSEWRTLQRILKSGPGPFELYDPTEAPNQLSIEDRLGIGWVTSTGTAVTANSNMRMAISAAPASVQTAISSSPAAANLTPVSASTAYTAAITVEGASSFTGTLSVYGYTSSPSGTGTQQGSNTNLTTDGRYLCGFTTGATIVYVEIRVARTAGTANLLDATVAPAIGGFTDPGKGVRTVQMPLDSWKSAVNFVGTAAGQSNRTSLTLVLEEQ
jgi:hypothetical protein